MRSIRHWTPRYVRNRVAAALYQRRNMDKPWLTPAANSMLATLLKPTDAGIEWGSGRSTCWLAQRLATLTSVEHDPAWHGRVREMIAARGLTNVDYRLVTERDPEGPERSPYVRVCAEMPDRSLGFALVDGVIREFCALAVLPKLAPGGVLVVDNINWFLDHPTHSPASRVGKGPANERWGEFVRHVAGWRMIWTSSGVTDTAIFFKPCAR
ncbi:MAG TPA: class I SAM-dependent methyltransferase [Phycisphaerales bacterium]|nr:class I SAM-dependent methyltransferase [Phycisphaerales bacterium]